MLRAANTRAGCGQSTGPRRIGFLEAIPLSANAANMDAFRLWLFAMVDRAEVLSPPAIRAQVIEWLTLQAKGN